MPGSRARVLFQGDYELLSSQVHTQRGWALGWWDGGGQP